MELYECEGIGRMIGTIEQMIKDMEHGVYDFTKEGECSQCGQCCTNFLPMSEKELKTIKRYYRDCSIYKPIQEHVREIQSGRDKVSTWTTYHGIFWR